MFSVVVEVEGVVVGVDKATGEHGEAPAEASPATARAEGRRRRPPLRRRREAPAVVGLEPRATRRREGRRPGVSAGLGRFTQAVFAVAPGSSVSLRVARRCVAKKLGFHVGAGRLDTLGARGGVQLSRALICLG